MMYLPAAFAEKDLPRIHAVIDRYPFGVLIAPHPDGTPEIAHVPFLLDRASGTLRFHLARGNPICALLAAGAAATAVFNGPDAYVSAAWYEAPTEQVPTWNYVAVHARGRAAVLDAPALETLLADLARRHEPAGAWSTELLDRAFLHDLMRAITGFSMKVERFDAKFKLSQNRSDADRERVRDALDQAGRGDVTCWMRTDDPE